VPPANATLFSKVLLRRRSTRPRRKVLSSLQTEGLDSVGAERPGRGRHGRV
jgi:hypothetical protein